jgi:F-box-like
MSSKLSVEVLQMILENVDKADLATVCQVNRLFCACAQDLLYRNITFRLRDSEKVIRTLARSTHLCRRVRSFSAMHLDVIQRKRMIKAFQSMSSLRSLTLEIVHDPYISILDVYTLELESFSFELYADICYSDGDEYSDEDEYPDEDELPVHPDGIEPLIKFLNSQPSLKRLELKTYEVDNIKVEATCLPNLTWVSAPLPWLRYLIPDRPVSEVNIPELLVEVEHEDLNFFTLSAAPIQKFTMEYGCLYPKPAKHLASVFPSLVHLRMNMYIETDEEVRVSLISFL